MVSFISSFNPGLSTLVSIAFDPTSGNVFIYDDFATTIKQYRPNGTFVSNTPFNGPISNDIDLDFAPEAININGFTVRENALLIANGDGNSSQQTQTLTAIDKTTGAVIGPNGTVFNIALPTLSTVGGSYHASRNTFFAVNWTNETIQEINLANGTVIRSFSVVPSGSPSFDVNYGDIEVNQASGNLFVVSSSQNRIRELTPTGAFVRDIDVSTFGVTGMSGIAFNDTTGEAYLSSTNGTVYRLGGFAALPTLPTLRINDITLTEGNSGTTKLATFTVTRTGTATAPITVNYATAPGTATAGSDYVSKSGSLSFATTETTKTISVTVNGDATVEPNETFFVNLSGVSGATLGDAQGQATITDDDISTTNPNITLTVNPSGISEDATTNFVYTFTRTGSTTNSLAVNFSVAGTATLNTDYAATGATSFNATTGRVTFAAGASTATVTVNPTADTTTETNETVNLSLTSGTGYTVGTIGAVTATIINDDGTRRQRGTAGNDVILGTTRSDIISGGTGRDRLTGGANGDAFYFRTPSEGIDTITDFTPNTDYILVSASGFGGGLIAGDIISSAQFVRGAAATNTSQRFIYNPSNGALFFDRDGSGTTSTAVQFATLSTNLALTFEDIWVS